MARQEGEGEQELVLLLLRKSDSLKLVLVYSAQAVAEWKKYKEQRDTLPSLMVSQRGCVQKGAPKVSKLKGDGVAVAPAMHGERPYGQGDLYLPIKKQNAVKAYLFETSPQSKQEIHRRSARLRNTKYKSAPAAEKKVSTKGKGRRHIFKLKNPIKAPESVSTIITAESIFHKGVYYQIGDVVSVIDEQDGKPYYAQIRGFIQDQYCEKSAALTWLIPTLSSPRDQFDPASYIIGPEEDLPRKMEYLEFVCHAPSEYFKSRSSPFPTVPTRPEKGYIWTHVGPTPAITIKETVANHL
ncbi:GATA zinc finger domain containing 1 [Ictidomys tridecemlineatus]|nr:GATA zinc finger domain containing 1 [Ictidomys tridecemlineatus]